MIAIIDYGLGNIKAIFTVYKNLNLPVKIASRTADLEGAEKLILPGVGAFDYAMDKLEKSGMRSSIDRLVTQESKKILGICVGMQMMGLSSEEGERKGLGWLNAKVEKFERMLKKPSLPIPHMGWNNINPRDNEPLFSGLDNSSHFYFLHSYYLQAMDDEMILASTQYGEIFTCAVNAGNVYGIQFHPEKSHGNGVRLLKNFAEL